MRIDSIEFFHVSLPLRKPIFGAAARFESLETVLVRMAGGGAAGWGEASPGNAPLATGQWAAGVFLCLRDWLAPAVAGAEIASGDDLQKRLAQFRGNQFAKAALDMAWWDLHARLQGKPLHEVLGGKQDAVEVGPTLDRMDSADEFLAAVGRAFEAGFPRLKLKFRPGWDVRMVEAVRREFPTETIHIDCEGALDLSHMEMLCRLDDFALAMVEQPLAADDLVGHAMVQEAVRTPVCLDESIATVRQADMALELESCRYVNLKPGRVGGLTPAVQIHDLCHDHCVPCYVGASPQSAVGARIGLALAAKPNCTYPADFFPSRDLLAADLAEPLLPERDPGNGVQRVRLASEPGIGIEPDAGELERLSLARAVVS
jgi:O-succinylbenzoate synthase